MNLKVKCPDDVKKKQKTLQVCRKCFAQNILRLIYMLTQQKKDFMKQYYDVCSQTLAVRAHAPEICLFNPAPAWVRWVH